MLSSQGESFMNSSQPGKSASIHNHRVTRRSFIRTTAAGSAAVLTGGLASLFKENASAGTRFPIVEASILQLQAAMATGQLSATELVHAYLDRMKQLNPTLHAVIET